MSVRVFLSYRREDSRHVVGRFRDHLTDALGEEFVFYDIDNIPFGADFRVVVRDRLAQVDVVLAFIGPAWVTERLHQQNDPVRMELAEAFRQHKTVIPVLIDSTPIPTVDQLPAELEALPYLNAPGLRADPDFRRDTERIVTFLRNIPSPTSTSAQKTTPDPNKVAEVVNRGIARWDKKDLVGAIADFTEAIRLDPTYVAAYNGRGIARRGKGDLRGAKADEAEARRLGGCADP